MFVLLHMLSLASGVRHTELDQPVLLFSSVSSAVPGCGSSKSYHDQIKDRICLVVWLMSVISLQIGLRHS